MMSLSISTLLAVLVAYFLMLPFLKRQHSIIGAEHSSADALERNEQMLRDLELDLAMGKLTTGEYTALQSSLQQPRDET